MNCELLNMKTIKITCLLYMAVLSPIIQGEGIEHISRNPLYQTRNKVDGIIRNDGTINNIFKPLKFLGSGGFSVTYRGELGQSKKIVAMKISPISWSFGDPVDEYLMYTYMRAVNNTTVEKYGIPTVYYYYGDWEGCTLLALTLLEPQFTRLIKIPKIRLRDLDILIIMREFVRITKYIHRCGICQRDVHLNNMMFRKNQAFIIDFNLSEKVNLGVGPNLDCRKRDWRKFLFRLCPLCGITVDEMNEANTLNNIENMQNNDGLRTVLMEFVENAFKPDDAEPINYNDMYRKITDEIHRRDVQEPALVSWLTDAQKNETIVEWSNNQIPSIEDIAEPETHFDYPELILDYFHDLA